MRDVIFVSFDHLFIWVYNFCFSMFYVLYVKIRKNYILFVIFDLLAFRAYYSRDRCHFADAQGFGNKLYFLFLC